MKTINKLLLVVATVCSMSVWADDAAEKATLEQFFSARETDYKSVLLDAEANSALKDSVNTLYQNSFAVIDTTGGNYIFQGFITLDGVIPTLPKEDTLYISQAAAAYLGQDACDNLHNKFASELPKWVDELKKCAGAEAPARTLPMGKPVDPLFSELPARIDGIQYAINGGLAYMLQIKISDISSANIEQATCALNSDIYFKSLVRFIKAFQTSIIYQQAKKHPLIYGESYQKALRLAELSKEKYTREVTSGNYGTICLDKKFNAMEGVEGLYVPSYKDASKLYCAEVKLSDVVAGGAYIFKADSAVIVLTLDGEAVAAAANNDHMIGWLAADSVLSATFISDHDGYALLASNQIVKPLSGSTIKQNRAFIDLANVSTNPPSAAGRYIALGINEATGLVDVNVNADANNNCKMLVNGQLIIIKDGVKYNAMGQKME